MSIFYDLTANSKSFTCMFEFKQLWVRYAITPFENRRTTVWAFAVHCIVSLGPWVEIGLIGRTYSLSQTHVWVQSVCLLLWQLIVTLIMFNCSKVPIYKWIRNNVQFVLMFEGIIRNQKQLKVIYYSICFMIVLFYHCCMLESMGNDLF